MERFFQITREPIDEAALNRSRIMSNDMGAAIVFCGVVREGEGTMRLEAIDYEAFEPMANAQFQKLFDEVQTRWPLESVRLIHRIGVVPVNEPSLWVEIIAPHRGEAFESCQWLIEEMKKRVPIWKRPVERI